MKWMTRGRCSIVFRRDGLVFINDYFDAEPGDFLQVQVVDADEHDLYAELCPG